MFFATFVRGQAGWQFLHTGELLLVTTSTSRILFLLGNKQFKRGDVAPITAVSCRRLQLFVQVISHLDLSIRIHHHTRWPTFSLGCCAQGNVLLTHVAQKSSLPLRTSIDSHTPPAYLGCVISLINDGLKNVKRKVRRAGKQNRALRIPTTYYVDTTTVVSLLCEGRASTYPTRIETEKCN